MHVSPLCPHFVVCKWNLGVESAWLDLKTQKHPCGVQLGNHCPVGTLRQTASCAKMLIQKGTSMSLKIPVRPPRGYTVQLSHESLDIPLLELQIMRKLHQIQHLDSSAKQDQQTHVENVVPHGLRHARHY